jgi:hypothetical protein
VISIDPRRSRNLTHVRSQVLTLAVRTDEHAAGWGAVEGLRELVFSKSSPSRRSQYDASRNLASCYQTPQGN